MWMVEGFPECRPVSSFRPFFRVPAPRLGIALSFHPHLDYHIFKPAPFRRYSIQCPSPVSAISCFYFPCIPQLRRPKLTEIAFNTQIPEQILL